MRSVEKAVCDALRESPYPAVRNLGCTYRGGVVTLTGRTSSYFLKQVAQSEVRRRLKDAAICNRVEVVPFDASTET